jgi:hypothetical protein
MGNGKCEPADHSIPHTHTVAIVPWGGGCGIGLRGPDDRTDETTGPVEHRRIAIRINQNHGVITASRQFRHCGIIVSQSGAIRFRLSRSDIYVNVSRHAFVPLRFTVRPISGVRATAGLVYHAAPAPRPRACFQIPLCLASASVSAVSCVLDVLGVGG